MISMITRYKLTGYEEHREAENGAEFQKNTETKLRGYETLITCQM